MAAQHSPAQLQPAPIIRQPKLEETEIASSYAKIRFPEFDSEDVETWFVCLEAAFYVNNVASDEHKFNAVIVALGTRAKFFHAAIAKCNKSTFADRYSTIKKVIDFFLPSENHPPGTSTQRSLEYALEKEHKFTVYIISATHTTRTS